MKSWKRWRFPAWGKLPLNKSAMPSMENLLKVIVVYYQTFRTILSFCKSESRRFSIDSQVSLRLNILMLFVCCSLSLASAKRLQWESLLNLEARICRHSKQQRDWLPGSAFAQEITNQPENESTGIYARGQLLSPKNPVWMCSRCSSLKRNHVPVKVSE